MGAKERILIIRLIDKIQDYPAFAAALGIAAEKQETSFDVKKNDEI